MKNKVTASLATKLYAKKMKILKAEPYGFSLFILLHNQVLNL